MLEETVDLVINSQAAFTFVATAIGAAAGVAAASFAVPAVSDFIQPRAVQASLCDFLPFIELMEDRKTIRCENAAWIRMIEFRGAELTLAPYTSPTGRGRAELFLARKQMLDELHKSSVFELRVFQIKARSPIDDNIVHPIPVLDEVRQKWNSRFKSVFKLRTFMMINVRSTDWNEAQDLLDKAEQLISTTLGAFYPKPMVEPDALSKNPDYTAGPLHALGSVFSPISKPAPRGFGYADRISALIAADRVSFSRNEARGILRFSNGREDRYAIILGLRDCGDKTSEDILRKIIALPIEATIFQVDRPHDPIKDKLTLEREVKASRFMRLSSRAPLEYLQVVDLVDGADSANRATLHDYSLFYIIYGRTPRECLDAETLVASEISTSGATVVREHVAAQANWFAQAPGDNLWPRTFRYTSSNIAANMFLQRANEGFMTSNWADHPITYFPTMDGQPYAFQFHSEPSRYNKEFGTDKETIAHGLIIGPTGAGKAQPLTTLVQTPFGAKRIGSLRAGDKIFGDDGLVHSVTGVFPQGEKDCYRATFADGRATECCDEHLWTVFTPQQFLGILPYDDHGRWETLPLSEIMARFGSRAAKDLAIPLCAPVAYPAKALAVEPYTLGAIIAANGVKNDSLSFTSRDIESLDRIRGENPDVDFVQANANVGLKTKIIETLTTLHNRTYNLTVERNDALSLCKSLVDLNLLDIQPCHKRIPQVYLHASIEQRISLLNGILDFKGEVSADGFITFLTSSEHLAQDMLDLVRSLGGVATLSKNRPVHRNYGLRQTPYNAFQIQLRLPNAAFAFHCERKRERLCPTTSGLPNKLRFKSFDYLGKKPMVCIMVDNPTKLYLADNYIVTHNTAFLTFAASMGLAIPNLRVYMFDRLNGCESMTRCSGGDYLSFDDQNISVEMNPFLQADTPANRVFLQRWLTMIGHVDPQSDGSAGDMAEIARCIQTIFDPNVDRAHKSIRGLLNSQFEARGRLRSNLRRWADQDLFGAYFNGERDALDLKSKRIIGFDMTTVLDNPELAPAIVDYLVHRIRQVSIETQDPSLIFIDETAPMLDADVRFRDNFVKTGLREGRKVKQAFILAFQDPQAVDNTGIGDSIRQQCQTTYFFRNRNTKPEDYKAFNLTEGETDFVTGISYADEAHRYAVLVKKTAQDDNTAHSAILNLDLSVLGKHLKVYNSGIPAVTEMRKAIDAYGPNNFVNPYIDGQFAKKR